MVYCGKKTPLAACVALSFGLAIPSFAAPRQMENLSRGLVASNVGKGMLVSWRLLGSDAPNTEFNLYRDGTKIATIAGNGATNYLDASGKATSKYTVAAVVGGKEGAQAGLSFVFDKSANSDGKNIPYATLKLDRPGDLKMPDGSSCSYTSNDMSVGDLDGDGELELVVKWDPSNQKDNSQSGYTGNVYIDGYKMNGKKLWRIDLGKNIRAGAHYTQFMVYDLDGDGIAEVAMKTSDGTVDGTDKVIGDKSKDYRTKTGTIMSGNEFLTVFNGKTGAAITTIDYVPGRNVTKNWGDTYGNRSERMLAAIAYLDGVHPSLIMCRGYYTNAYVVAYDFDGKQLKQRWYHKARESTAKATTTFPWATSTATARTKSCTVPRPSSPTARSFTARGSATATRSTFRTWIPTARALNRGMFTKKSPPPTPTTSAVPTARSSGAPSSRTRVSITAAASPQTSTRTTADSRCGAARATA